MLLHLRDAFRICFLIFRISFWPFPLSSLETEADLYERCISTRKVQAGTFLLSLAQVTHSRSPALVSLGNTCDFERFPEELSWSFEF